MNCCFRVALLGLGLSAAAAASCKQFVLHIPGDAESALHRVHSKLASTGTPGKGLPPALTKCFDELQASRVAVVLRQCPSC